MLLKKDKIYGLLAGLLAALGWGSIGLWIKEIPLPALEIATYRFLGAGLFLTCLTWSVYKKTYADFCIKKIIGSAVCGFVLALQFVSTILAYQKLLVGEATVLTNLHIFIIILSYFSILMRHKRLFLYFGLGGLLLIFGLHLVFIQEKGLSLNYFGLLMGFSSAVLFGLYTVLVSKFFPDSPERYLGLIFIFGTIPMIAYLFFTNGINLANISQSGWMSLFILLIFSTIIAHFAYLLAVKWIGALGAGIMSYFAIIIGFFVDFFLGEPVSTKQWLGAVVLIFVLACLQYLTQQLDKWKKPETIQF